MRRIIGLGVLVLLALGVGFLPTETALAAGCETKWGGESTASTCEDVLGWSYDPSSHNFEYGSVFASARPADPYEYKKDFACDANGTSAGGDVGCGKAFNCPVKLDPDGKPMMGTRIRAWQRLKGTNDPWKITEDGVCQYAGRTVPMKDVVAAARQSIEKEVGKPSIVAQPPNGVTLVNFTSLFHAPQQTVTSLLITAPISGAITAVPQYTWDLGEGITAEGAGHPYDAGIDPSKEESNDYYVKAFYHAAGLKNVQLTLTWQASITLTGSGAIPLDPIIFTADTTTTAKTAKARLVAN